MSTGAEVSPPDPDGLQFDHAEFDQAQAPAAVTCGGCGRPIADSYFEINRMVFCEPCRQVIAARLGAGAGPSGFARSLGMGVAAGLVGAILYAAVQWIFHAEIALLTILVGYMVGTMVRKGSGGLGGRAYQAMAVVLTFLAIALSSVISTLGPLFAQNPQALRQLTADQVGVILYLCTRQYLDQLRQNPLSIVIVGFGLWQAWRLNARSKVVVTGPYRVGDAGPTDLARGASGHA